MADHQTTEMRPENFNRRGVMTFLKVYLEAPTDADIELRIASAEDDDADQILIVSIQHPSITKAVVGLTATQARTMADVAERTLNEFRGGPGTEGLPNLVLALRAGVDKLMEEMRHGR